MNIRNLAAEPENLAVSVILALVVATAGLYSVADALRRLSEVEATASDLAETVSDHESRVESLESDVGDLQIERTR